MTEATPPAPQPPSQLGQYIVIKDIAEGTFGTVKSERRGPARSASCADWLAQWACMSLPATASR